MAGWRRATNVQVCKKNERKINTRKINTKLEFQESQKQKDLRFLGSN
jgi:hypothetical protein